jgi:hypothetical protein
VQVGIADGERFVGRPVYRGETSTSATFAVIPELTEVEGNAARLQSHDRQRQFATAFWTQAT